MKLTSYLVFNGQAEEAANFYADVLGGKIDNLYRYESMPPTPEMPVPEECKQMILHCCIAFPGGSMAMADSLPHDKRNFGGMRLHRPDRRGVCQTYPGGTEDRMSSYRNLFCQTICRGNRPLRRALGNNVFRRIIRSYEPTRPHIGITRTVTVAPRCKGVRNGPTFRGKLTHHLP